MKNFYKKFIFLFIVTVLIVPMFASAQPTEKPKDYVVLAPLPGIGDSAGRTTNLDTYLPQAFNLAVAIAVVLAFIMISFGGFIYATSDALQKKDDGRKYITDAITGLLLVIGAYTILYTINPKILDFSLIIPRSNIQTPPGGVQAGVPMTQAQIDESNSIRAKLPSGVTAYAGPCTNGQTTGCVNLNGLPQSALTGLGALAKSCGCSVSIQGGTEGGHSSHGPGIANVDLDSNPQLNKTLLGNRRPQACTVYLQMPGATYRAGALWEPKGSMCPGATKPSSGDHWHVIF